MAAAQQKPAAAALGDIARDGLPVARHQSWLAPIRLFTQPDFGLHLSDFCFVFGAERSVCELDGDFLQGAGELER